MISPFSTISGDWPDLIENRDVIEFHDIFDMKKEGLKEKSVQKFFDVNFLLPFAVFQVKSHSINTCPKSPKF